MKEFYVYWSILLFLLLLFCVTTHLLLFSSICYMPLFLVSLVWVVEVLVFAILFIEILDAVEGKKISGWLYSSGILLLLIGILAVFKVNHGDEKTGICMIISVFSLCAAVLSMLFGSVIKSRKIDGQSKDDES